MILPARNREAWQRFEIRRIEDLGNAILGAGLVATQMNGPPVRGSLAFAACDGVIFSSGWIEGNVLLTGRLAPEEAAVGLVLRAGERTRLGMVPAADGVVATISAGGTLDAYIGSGTLYFAATFAADRHAARTPSATVIPAEVLRPLRDQVPALHEPSAPACHTSLGGEALAVMLRHLARTAADPPPRVSGLARIVQAARNHIDRNLATPISTEALAAAVGTSPRTLYRAFASVLGDTPQGYVRRARLHCIRRRLLAIDQPPCSVVAAARRLGLDRDMGRLAQRYRALFGEPPSATLARRRAHAEGIALL